MKKKGLIISTVVMVVVLIASLTTATYAWFSSDAAAQVSGIELGAKSATSLQIGVLKTTTGTSISAITDMVYGDNVAYTSAWGGGIEGIGSVINFKPIEALAGIEKAVSVAKAQISNAGAGSSTTIAKDAFYKANGNGIKGKAGDDGYDNSTVAEAVANTDYFDAAFGVVAAKPNLKQMYMTVTVTATSTETIGMAAAIHFAFYIDGNLVDVTTGKAGQDAGELSADTSHISAFDGLTHASNYGIKEGALAEYTTGKGTSKKEAGQGAVWTYVLEIAKSDTDAFTAFTGNNIGAATKHVVRVLAWIEGTDDSCINDTTGTGAMIEIQFMGEATAKTIENGRITA